MERSEVLHIHQDILIMMTSLTVASYLACLLLWRPALVTNLKFSFHVRQDSGFISANAGETVTLQCFCERNVAAMFYWYKQTLGQKPKLVSTFYKHNQGGVFSDDFKNDTRFSLEYKNGKNDLSISGLRYSDSATYYCVGFYAYAFEFGEGITVSVKSSDLNVNALVHQSASETMQSGDSVILSCALTTGSCGGEHSFWFNSLEGSHPGLIYTHGGRNDQCEKKPNSERHTCFHSLPLKSLNKSPSGTYHCAVTSCGQILFGDRTKLELEDEVNAPNFLVHILSIALAFTIVLNVLTAFSVCKLKKKSHCQCTGTQARFPDSAAANVEDYRDADNLHYAALRRQRLNQSGRQTNDSSGGCVYSTIRE